MWRGLLSIFFLFPLVAFGADVEFVHIEYDPEGSDATREWVRVQNVSGSTLDLSGWKFYENGVNHRLTPVGSAAVPQSGTAVIASDAATFLSEYPYSGDVVFDSSFSLSNSGETLELRDASGATIAQVSYQGTPQKPLPAPRVLAPLAAAEGSAPPRAEGSGWQWYVALVVLTGFSSYAIIASRRRGENGYRIIEVEVEKR